MMMGVIAAVHFAQVTHEGGEGARVGVEVFLTEGRKYLQAATRFILSAGGNVAGWFSPRPERSRTCCFPGGEPQRHET